MKPEELKEQMEAAALEIKGEVGKLVKSHEELDGVIKTIQEQQKTDGAEFATTKGKFGEVVEQVKTIEDQVDDLVAKMTALPQQREIAKSIGMLAAANDQVKTYAGGNMELAKMAASLFAAKANMVGDVEASGGATVVPFHRPDIITEPDQPLTIRDLLITLTISTNAVEWAQEDTFTNAAAPQAGEGAALPESAITFTKQNTPVQTVGHWIPVSRQLLADSPGIQSFVDRRMTYGLKLAEENQLLLGDGTGNNLTGLVTAATAYDTLKDVAGDTKVDNLRRAILQVSMASYPTTGVVLNPTDWADLELEKTDDKAYLFSNPVDGGVPRIWGKRVVESLSLTIGEYLLGAFGMAATLWDRQDVTVRVAEQHASFAIAGLVAMILEERLALTTELPLGLVTGTLHATTV